MLFSWHNKLCSKSKLCFRESERKHQSDLEEGRMAWRIKECFDFNFKGYGGHGWSEVGSWSSS